MTANIASTNPATGVIVFTDLDGTLLDHSNYDYEPAQPTLDRLNRLAIPLILASSKTAAEMIPLRTELGFEDCPMICENGSGVVPAGSSADSDRSHYQKLRAELEAIPPALRGLFEGFGDMTPARIGDVTGLIEDQAVLAAQRAFSEPGLWTGSQHECEQFLSLLGTRGITARRGGRFLTLSFGATKADQLDRISAQLDRTVIIALGDAPNDAEMLNAADYAIVLPNAHGHPVTVSKDTSSRVIHAEQPGPMGWHSALSAVLDELGIEE